MSNNPHYSPAAIQAERDQGRAIQRAIVEALAKLDPEKQFQAFALRALGDHYGEATEDEQDRATQFTCAEEVEPCEVALCSRSDDGTWILGWIWSPTPDDEDEDGEG